MATRAFTLCDGRYYGKLQSRRMGWSFSHGFPGDAYRTAAEALELMGRADAAWVMARAGADFPIRSALDKTTKSVLQRARARLTRAYRLRVRTYGYPHAIRCAYHLVCLDVLEKTAGLKKKGRDSMPTCSRS